MNNKIATRVAGAASLALCLGVTLGAPAQAKTADPHAAGTCSATSSVKLHTSEKKQTIKVTAKVKTGVEGELWGWQLSDNGVVVGTDATATGKNGKLVIRQTIPNLEGTDTIDFLAVDTVTGEVCSAEVVVD